MTIEMRLRDGNDSLQHRKQSAGMPPETEDVKMNLTKRPTKIRGNAEPSLESEPMIYSGPKIHRRQKLLLCSTEWSMLNGDIWLSCLVDFCRPASICISRTYEKHDYISIFLNEINTREVNRANMFLSLQYVLFVQNLMSLYLTQTGVNEHRLMTDLKLDSDGPPMINNRPLVLLYYAEHREDVLRHGYTILKVFLDDLL